MATFFTGVKQNDKQLSMWINNIVLLLSFYLCVCAIFFFRIDISFSEIVEGAWYLVLIDEQCNDDKDTV